MLEQTEQTLVVGEPATGMPGADSIRKWTLLGSIIGFFVVGGLFGFATYAFGGSVAGAVAVGLMTGLLGGPGFGGMLGFTHG